MSLYVPDRVPYFLRKLADRDEAWSSVTIAAVVRIAKATSMSAVTTALGFAVDNHPVIEGSAYGWLAAAARSVHDTEEP